MVGFGRRDIAHHYLLNILEVGIVRASDADRKSVAPAKLKAGESVLVGQFLLRHIDDGHFGLLHRGLGAELYLAARVARIQHFHLYAVEFFFRTILPKLVLPLGRSITMVSAKYSWLSGSMMMVRFPDGTAMSKKAGGMLNEYTSPMAGCCPWNPIGVDCGLTTGCS